MILINSANIQQANLVIILLTCMTIEPLIWEIEAGRMVSAIEAVVMYSLPVEAFISRLANRLAWATNLKKTQISQMIRKMLP